MDIEKLVVGDRFTIKNGAGTVYTITAIDLRLGVIWYEDAWGEGYSCNADYFEEECELFLLQAGSNFWTNLLKCECGVDKTGAGGLHSSYCPKHNKELA